MFKACFTPDPAPDGTPEGTPGDLYRKSERVAAMKQSATVAMTEKSFELRQAGKDVLALSVGEPDFDPPAAVIQATMDAVTAKDGEQLKTRYTSVQGTNDLRVKIAEYLSSEKQIPCTKEQVLVSNGGKQCLVQAIMALTGPGDEVLVPAPFWVSYTEQCTLAGSTSVVIPTAPEKGFLLEPEVLESYIKPNTRMLIICNPSNPTGVRAPHRTTHPDHLRSAPPPASHARLHSCLPHPPRTGVPGVRPFP